MSFCEILSADFQYQDILDVRISGGFLAKGHIVGMNK